ncbi:MAG: hypothetical protein LBQ42_08125 [Synergistaceae bacterium]|jgi:hypothetical protein|nr:hypothetical protein [Synergistaceae bacterium]
MDVTLTPENIGQNSYDTIVRQIKEGKGVMYDPEDFWYVPDAGFLEKNGIRIMARFADGVEENLTDVFQCYFFEPTDDSFTMLIRGLFADSGSKGGKHSEKHSTIKDGGKVTLPFIFDGKPDGIIEGAFWVSSSPSGGGSSGGCNTGLGGVIPLVLFAAMTRLKRKEGK